MNRKLPVQLILRRFQHGTNQPSGTTGIEHALKFKQIGQSHKQDPKLYKCEEYLNFNKYSFYDTENAINPARVPQPSNKKPDVEPKVRS
ncbi:unnamed protein product [Bursaphelenchus xylophilus]|uniref:(pine wood nematode) hypothetical protein n=1 Tax=Bursaphelenchus xylophilus TaxID=6326 RepID=A0A1I7S4A8_BURXY|nr:unnamed protein product [Bursaphelenchus xylophilus]CAG9116899.1 unnamed protein product [Bursaphelenchus xylophilus]